jgi:glucans biosynthesis protein C
VARRYPGLDAARALLMLGGVVLHASQLKEDRPFFLAIDQISAAFRMGAFFAVSGLLAGYSLARAGQWEWVRRRLVRLGPPTLFGLLLICPLMGALRYVAVGRPGEFWRLVLDWYHLWFMVALLAYTALTPVLVQADARWRVTERLAARGEVAGAQAALLVACSAATFALPLIWMELGRVPGLLAPVWHMRVIPQYLSCYVLGLALARSDALCRLALADWKLPAGVLGSVLLLHLLPLGSELLAAVDALLCPPAATLLIIAWAVRVPRIPMAMTRLAEASLTIYLVHFPVELAVNALLLRAEWNIYAEYFLSMAIGGGLSYAFHRAMVRRSAIIGLVVNGRVRERRAVAEPAVAEPVVGVA